ncbi:DUF2339 domain-containing protein [Viridibacterium curvum]|uniref:DUF2339 domain-containing protein n=1 Tax=Viridibacterium curvum TaxID=1101404 RepID=A0ABP9QZP7_9RHOO
MGGDLFVIGALLAVGYLVVLPLLLIVTWQRSRRVEREFAVLEEGMQFLLKRIQKLEGIGEPSAPPPAVSTPPISAPAPIEQSAPPFSEAVSTAAPPASLEASVSIDEPPPADEVPPPAQPIDTVATPRPPAEPPAPNPLSGLVSWFLRGNPIAKLGVLLLFFGLAFLFKYAAERDMLPIELRLAGAAGLAIGLLSLGWRLRDKAPLYGLVLQGGAVGALYLTSFAAFRLYDLLPHGLSLALLIVICAASVALAVLQRAQSLAVLASTGGYLAPVLLSTGGGSHIALFSYYALLSLGILAVSLWQQWRPLNLVGFFFSFGVALLWGADHYSPEHYASSQFFLLLNLVIFGLLAMRFALRHPESKTRGAGLIDGTLVFGTPLVGFGIQYAITKQWQYGPAFSALGFAALYLPLAAWLVRRWPETGRRMAMSLLAVGAGFVTLAIPLALSARWTALAWALEGLGVLWAGRLQQQPRISWSGTALLVLAAISGGIAFDGLLDATSFLLIAFTLALCWIAGGHLWRATADAAARSDERLLSPALLIGGVAFWLLGIADGADRLLDGPEARMAALACTAVSAWLWQRAGERSQWPLLRHASWVLWPVSALILVLQTLHDEHALAVHGWALAWPLALGLGWYLLRRAEQPATLLHPRASVALHAGLTWGLLGLCFVELGWQMEQLPWGMTEWRFACFLVFSGIAILLLRALTRRGIWPLSTHAMSYWLGGLLPVLPIALFLLLIGNLLDAQMPETPYIPLLNPLEEAALFALLMLEVWRQQCSQLLGRSLPALRLVLYAIGIWWANGLLLRTLAEIGDLRWQWQALWDSRLVQTSFALIWTLAALATMLLAVRRHSRAVWMAGAALLGIVIVKLFLVDSAHGGGLARAIAFIGVALLILAIGYFAPLPPRRTTDDAPPQGDSA